MLNPLNSRPDPRPSPPPARRARDDAPVFTVRDEHDRASDARQTDRAAAPRTPERDGRASTDRSATATPARGPRTEPRSDDTAIAASDTSNQTADARAVSPSAGEKPGRIAGKTKGETTEDTAGDGDVAPVAMPLPVATTVPIATAGSPVTNLPSRAADPDASAEPRPTDQETAPILPGAPPIDPSLQVGTVAQAVAPSADARSTAVASDECPEADEASPKDPAAQPPPQPVALAVAAIPVLTVATAGSEAGAGASSVSGASARSAGRSAGRAATGPIATGNAGPAGPGAIDGEVGAAPVVARPTSAVATGEATPSRPKGAITSEASPQVSTASPAGSVDFAAHLAQMADPASTIPGQTPTAAATSAASDATASRTATGVPIGDVPVEIGLRALDGSSRFDIRLSPEDLGRIDVKLDIDGDGQVRAHLVVDRPETLAFLQRDGDALQRAFEQAGFKPAETGIAFSLRDPGQDAGGGRNGSGENGQRPQPAPRAGQGHESGPDAVPTTWRTLQAGRAGIDLRI